MSGIRVSINSDSVGIRKEIGAILAPAGSLVIAEADNGPGMLRLIQALQPDVAVIDTEEEPGGNGAREEKIFFFQGCPFCYL